jgi:hypothetical protein
MVMSNKNNINKCPQPSYSCHPTGWPKGRPKKDNSVKTDYFLNCRCCKEIISADFRSKFDKRYCQDCA